jgi:hypothetical protein
MIRSLYIGGKKKKNEKRNELLITSARQTTHRRRGVSWHLWTLFFRCVRRMAYEGWEETLFYCCGFPSDSSYWICNHYKGEGRPQHLVIGPVHSPLESWAVFVIVPYILPRISLKSRALFGTGKWCWWMLFCWLCDFDVRLCFEPQEYSFGWRSFVCASSTCWTWEGGIERFFWDECVCVVGREYLDDWAYISKLGFRALCVLSLSLALYPSYVFVCYLKRERENKRSERSFFLSEWFMKIYFA